MDKVFKSNQTRLIELLEYIDLNLGRDFNMEELASKLCLSKSRFQRVFKSYMGEPVFSYIKRRRFEHACIRLGYSSNVDLKQLSVDLNFSEQANFSRDFKKYYAISPTDFREEFKRILKKNRRKTKITAEIIQLDKTEVLYIHEFGYYAKASENAWEKMSYLIKNNNIISSNLEFFGIIHDDDTITDRIDCRYDACISGFNHFSNMDAYPKKEIVGKYAKFIHKGSYKSINTTYDAIFRTWLLESDYELEITPIIEKYLNNPKEVEPTELLTEIYIPIK